MGRTTRRYGLQSRVFVTDPWAIIRHSIDQRCASASKAQAQAFRTQAQDYFRAAEVAGLFAAKPVLLYYCFLNLVKAFVLTQGTRVEYGAAFHGLKERVDPGGRELVDSFLEALPSGANVNIFDDFVSALTTRPLPAPTTYRMSALLPQLLQGHRLWCAAAGENERFVEVTRIDVMQDAGAKALWLVVNILEDDLTRIDIAHNRLLADTRLRDHFREVRSNELIAGRGRLLKFEQLNVIPYNHRPSDSVPDLVSTVKHSIWSNVLSVPPYRKYFVYVAPAAEHGSVLPQLCSIFAFFYYLGSVTRYRPHKVETLMKEAFGAQLEEAVLNLPNQFLYLLASAFGKQDVTRAAIV